ncbi:MAG: acyl-CoA dehydrogenase family protein [Planctomycetota bacterium]
MGKKNIYDFYDVDSLLTEEEKLIRDLVREFTEKEVKPKISMYYEKGEFPVELIKKMAEMGLLGGNIKGYGCSGLNNVAYGLVMQELEAGDSGLRSFVSVQSALVMFPIYEFGSEEQKEYYLPKLAKGELIGCFGLTEHDVGSNPSAIKTTAKRKGDRWILNGTKMWITNGTLADIAIIWAKNEDKIIEGFIVDTHSKGFKGHPIKGKLSLRASDTAELILEDVEVPESQRLPKTSGLKSALSCLSQARYGIAWGAVGAALDCFKTALSYSKIREQFDKPIASFQLTQEKLVYMLTEITKAQLLCLQLGRLKDKNQCDFAQISLAKRNNVDMALKIARLAREILAANGILLDYPVFRHMVNLESVKTYEGSHEIHTLILGEYITEIPAFK